MAKENTAEVYMDRADALIDSNPNEAIERYLRAIELEHKNYECYSRAAGAFLKIRKFDQAITYYDQAIAITIAKKNNEGTAICYNNKGRVYVAMGNINEAIACNNKAIECNGSNSINASAHGNNAFCYNRLGNYGKAMEEVNKAIALHANNQKFHETQLAITNNMRNQQSDNGFADRENNHRQTNQSSACCIII